MKRTLVIALVAIAALYLALGQAIANNQAAGNANVQEELKRLENDRAQAVLKGDTAALDQIALAGTGNATHYFPATGDVAALSLGGS